MFEPFIWMFNTENFKKRCFQLSITIIITLVLTIIVSIANGVFFSTNYLVFHILLGITILLPVLLILLLQGYFWELTANIISRELDIQASNIYSGKIKQIFKIQLPEFNPIKFIWRGFASVIASVLMFIPFILLVISTAYTSIFILPFENIDFYHKMYEIS